MKAASNYFLVNMAVADLIVTVFNMPIEMKTVVVGPKWLVSRMPGVMLCKSSISSWFLAVNVSTSTLAAIALDRFLLVFYPHKKIITKRASYIIIALTWISAFLFTLPPFAFSSLEVRENGGGICDPKFDGIEVYSMINPFSCHNGFILRTERKTLVKETCYEPKKPITSTRRKDERENNRHVDHDCFDICTVLDSVLDLHNLLFIFGVQTSLPWLRV